MQDNSNDVDVQIIDAQVNESTSTSINNSEQPTKKSTRWCRYDTFSIIGIVLGISALEVLIPAIIYILISLVIGITAVVCVELASVGLVFSIVGMVFSIIANNDQTSARLRKLKRAGQIIGIVTTVGNAAILFLSIIIIFLVLINSTFIPEFNSTSSSLITALLLR